jgi:hypothetical protein
MGLPAANNDKLQRIGKDGTRIQSILHANDNKKLAKIRLLDRSDPRSLDHPSHKEQWRELARAIGRQIARDERDGLSGQHIGG